MNGRLNAALSSDRFVGLIAGIAVGWTLVQWVVDNRKRAREWLAEYHSSPRAIFARSQRERMIAAEMDDDCGCGDG